MANAYPRESVEFQPVLVTLNGAPVTTGVSLAVVRDGQRPVTFTAAATMDGLTGIMVAGLAPGVYRIYAQLANGQETPVIDCGYFYID
jgi:saccharopine dehydrogenase-like NADP-dependent oxidoreductase